VTDSKENRVLRFFIDNPDEELTLQDIMTKFDCTENYARVIISSLRSRGYVESTVVVRKALIRGIAPE